MKKSTLVGLIAAYLAPTLATANKPIDCPVAFQGFHLGGNVGIGVGDVTRYLTFTTPTATGTTILTRLGASMGLTGIDGGVNVGYTHVFQKTYGLGLEFVANKTTLKGATRDWTNAGPGRPLIYDSTTTRLENSFQLRANFSYIFFEKVAAKLIAGWDISRWKMVSNINSVPLASSAGTPTQLNTVNSKYFNGFIIGAGVDLLASQHFIIGLDATLSIFENNSFRRVYRSPGIANPVTLTTRFTPAPYGKIALVAKFIY